MKSDNTFSLLTSKLFLTGLIVLLSNDIYLKYHFSNFITGKLSDFAGIFIFPFFFSVLFRKYVLQIYTFTFLFFVFWKLETSDNLILLTTKLTNIRFHRTIDISDLLALAIMPFSYKYFKSQQNKVANQINANKLIPTIPISIIAIFSFCSSSNPREFVDIHIVSNKIYELPFNKETLFKKIYSGNHFSDDNYKNLKDSLFYLYFDIPEYNASATVVAEIKQIENRSIIELNYFNEYEVEGKMFEGVKKSDIDACKNLKAKDFEKYFEDGFINVLLNKRKLDRGPFFGNKKQWITIKKDNFY